MLRVEPHTQGVRVGDVGRAAARLGDVGRAASHVDGDAVLQRVELPAGERVANVRVLRYQRVDPPDGER